MKTLIHTTPHSKQRYDTCGDWFTLEDGSKVIVVSELPDPRYEVLVAVHELIEQALCDRAGVTQEQVDAFDMAFAGEGEPGDDLAAPYHHQHVAATEIEQRLATMLGVNWAEYEKAIDAL